MYVLKTLVSLMESQVENLNLKTLLQLNLTLKVTTLLTQVMMIKPLHLLLKKQQLKKRAVKV